MSQETKPLWAYHQTLLSGHRIWKDANSGRWAIADSSADGLDGSFGTPDETDDGVLWVNPNRDVVINRVEHQLYVNLPVIDGAGRDHYLITVEFRDLPALVLLGVTKFHILGGTKNVDFIAETDRAIAALRMLGYRIEKE